MNSKTWDVRMNELETAVMNTAMAKAYGMAEGKHGGSNSFFFGKKRGEERVRKAIGHN